jgi:hypothetical protein
MAANRESSKISANSASSMASAWPAQQRNKYQSVNLIPGEKPISISKSAQPGNENGQCVMKLANRLMAAISGNGQLSKAKCESRKLMKSGEINES